MYFDLVMMYSRWFPNNETISHPYIYNVGYVISIYLAIVIGLYQNFNMIKLSIQIRLPLSTAEDLTRLKSMTRVSFIVTNIFAVLAVGCMIGFSVGIDQTLHSTIESSDTEGWEKFMTIFGVTTGTFYTILMIVMGVCYYILDKALK